VYGTQVDPKERTMIAERMRLIRGSCPQDRPLVTAISKVERLT
jgi:hypothetical protein